ncbi:hypothetical protein L3X38_036634 [Prunus dulcis]|uniref:Uncharacterized protein n=1 Tax=Prunus dulcis TaxID=3755 RepID=A0AAD4YNS3_PRUDU|nr:hypothetical protein L3X38_036634 [Prunus dulcis]
MFYNYSTILSFEEGSRSPNSKGPLYLWGGSKVYKKRFVAKLHRVTTEAHFSKWLTTCVSTRPNVYVRLATPLTDDAPRLDPNNPDAKIITFCPFYFSLGFTFPLSKFFKKVFYVMECAPSQCTPNVYLVIICFDNQNCFFKLDLMIGEFFYFFEVRRYKKYALVCVCNAELFNSLSHGDHVPLTYCDENEMSKKLDLKLEMAKVHQAMNIPARFSRMALTVEQVSEEEVSSAEKTQVGVAPSLSVRVKYFVDADSKKIGDMRNIWDILFKSPTDKLKIYNSPCKEVCSRTSLPAEKQKATDIRHRSSSRLHQSRDEDRNGRTAPLSKNRDPPAESRAVKHGADSALLPPLEARMAAAQKVRKLSAGDGFFLNVNSWSKV